MTFLQQVIDNLSSVPLIDSVVYGGVSEIEGTVLNVVHANRNQDTFDFSCQILNNYFQRGQSSQARAASRQSALDLTLSAVQGLEQWLRANMNVVSFSPLMAIDRTGIAGYEFSFVLRKQRKAPSSKRPAPLEITNRIIDYGTDINGGGGGEVQYTLSRSYDSATNINILVYNVTTDTTISDEDYTGTSWSDSDNWGDLTSASFKTQFWTAMYNTGDVIRVTLTIDDESVSTDITCVIGEKYMNYEFNVAASETQDDLYIIFANEGDIDYNLRAMFLLIGGDTQLAFNTVNHLLEAGSEFMLVGNTSRYASYPNYKLEADDPPLNFWESGNPITPFTLVYGPHIAFGNWSRGSTNGWPNAAWGDWVYRDDLKTNASLGASWDKETRDYSPS